MDLSLCSSGLANYIMSWNILSDRYPCSDHEIIRTTLQFDCPDPEIRLSINWNRVNWPAFNDLLFPHLTHGDFPAENTTICLVDQAPKRLYYAINNTMSSLALLYLRKFNS